MRIIIELYQKIVRTLAEGTIAVLKPIFRMRG